MNEELKGQVALVTGASRGIGAAIALELAQRGALVIGTATTDAGAQKVSEALSAHGGRGERLEVNDAAQHVGDLQELHGVHVAGQHDQPARPVLGKRGEQHRTELVQLNRVAGGAVVANREGP